MHRQSGLHIARRGMDVLIGVRGLAEVMVDEARNAGMRAEFSPGRKKPAGGWRGKPGAGMWCC